MTRAEIVRHDLAHVWHPFTQMREYASHDTVVVARGRGRSLVDADGRAYLDGVSSLWCNLFGHRVPSIDRAVRRQLGRVAHSTLLGVTNEPAVELARRLVEVAPRGLTRVFYSDDGSTAVEVALKMAFQYWQQAHGGRHRARQ
ncbi:MAG: aminotransferase class III-fold pyridoxal phosphate-dependent enzyme, partial [Planctomycetota bacterium]